MKLVFVLQTKNKFLALSLGEEKDFHFQVIPPLQKGNNEFVTLYILKHLLLHGNFKVVVVHSVTR